MQVACFYDAKGFPQRLTGPDGQRLVGAERPDNHCGLFLSVRHGKYYVMSITQLLLCEHGRPIRENGVIWEAQAGTGLLSNCEVKTADQLGGLLERISEMFGYMAASPIGRAQFRTLEWALNHCRMDY